MKRNVLSPFLEEAQTAIACPEARPQVREQALTYAAAFGDWLRCHHVSTGTKVHLRQLAAISPSQRPPRISAYRRRHAAAALVLYWP